MLLSPHMIDYRRRTPSLEKVDQVRCSTKGPHPLRFYGGLRTYAINLPTYCRITCRHSPQQAADGRLLNPACHGQVLRQTDGLQGSVRHAGPGGLPTLFGRIKEVKHGTLYSTAVLRIWETLRSGTFPRVGVLMIRSTRPSLM